MLKSGFPLMLSLKRSSLVTKIFVSSKEKDRYMHIISEANNKSIVLKVSKNFKFASVYNSSLTIDETGGRNGTMYDVQLFHESVGAIEQNCENMSRSK